MLLVISLLPKNRKFGNFDPLSRCEQANARFVARKLWKRGMAIMHQSRPIATRLPSCRVRAHRTSWSMGSSSRTDSSPVVNSA